MGSNPTESKVFSDLFAVMQLFSHFVGTARLTKLGTRRKMQALTRTQDIGENR